MTGQPQNMRILLIIYDYSEISGREVGCSCKDVYLTVVEDYEINTRPVQVFRSKSALIYRPVVLGTCNTDKVSVETDQ